MRSWRLRLAICGLVLCSLEAPLAAQPLPPKKTSDDRPRGKPLPWKPNWQKVSTLEYGLAFGFGALGLGAVLFGPGRDRAIDRHLGIDDKIRDLLVADTPRGRLWARDTSDVALVVLVSYPIAVDALLNAAWYRDSPEVAKQMVLMDLEALAITGGVTSLFKALVLRERPYGQTCGQELSEQTNDCRNKDRYYSHFSGHSSAAFTSASLICMHHAQHSLWERTATWLPCASGYALATATATLRIIGDRHYASDILVGAATGALTGLLIPWLHYRHGSPELDASWLGKHRIGLIPSAQSLTLKGVF